MTIAIIFTFHKLLAWTVNQQSVIPLEYSMMKHIKGHVGDYHSAHVVI